jgi:hypothetical protein
MPADGQYHIASWFSNGQQGMHMKRAAMQPLFLLSLPHAQEWAR